MHYEFDYNWADGVIHSFIRATWKSKLFSNQYVRYFVSIFILIRLA